MAICFWPAFQNYTASANSSSAQAISSNGQWTIATVTLINGGLQYVTLSSTTGDVGDLVEVHNDNSSYNGNVTVQDTNGNVLGTAPRLFRKITSTIWSGIQ